MPSSPGPPITRAGSPLGCHQCWRRREYRAQRKLDFSGQWASYVAPASITLSANAADTDGSIAQVEFFQGATLLNTDTVAPYSFDWTNVSAGTHTLTARATDNLGGTTTSAAVNITVTAAP
jgi:Bacterial Ig domain